MCTYLRDEPGLAFDYCNSVTAVDYLHTDEKKAAKRVIGRCFAAR